MTKIVNRMDIHFSLGVQVSDRKKQQMNEDGFVCSMNVHKLVSCCFPKAALNFMSCFRSLFNVKDLAIVILQLVRHRSCSFILLNAMKVKMMLLCGALDIVQFSQVICGFKSTYLHFS